MKHNMKYKESLLHKPLNKAGHALISSVSTCLPKKWIFNEVLKLFFISTPGFKFQIFTGPKPSVPQAPLTVTVNLDLDPGFWPNLVLDPDPGSS